MTTYIEAINSINKKIFDAWFLYYEDVTGILPTDGLKSNLFYDGQEIEKPPSNDVFWGRVTFKTINEEQHTLANSEGVTRYKSTGLVIVQIFCPRSFLNSVTKGRELATITRNAFRGQSTCENVWFKNARIAPLPAEDDFLRFNVICEYEFYERV